VTDSLYSEVPEEPSKTQKKKDSLEMQRLGADLSRLSGKELDRLDLSAELRSSVDVAQSIKHRTALKRQHKYIGRLLRQVDTEFIRSELQKLQSQGRDATKLHHRLESWRDRLLAEGDAAIGDLLVVAPDVDRQYLRQLLRKGQSEAKLGKAPRSARLLYKYLREVFS